MTALDDEHVGQLVRAIRVFRGWTPQALAERADVDVKTIRTLESGKRWPQDTTQRRIEDALRIPGGTIEIAREDHEYRRRFLRLVKDTEPSEVAWLDPDDVSPSGTGSPPPEDAAVNLTEMTHAELVDLLKSGHDVGPQVIDLMEDRFPAAYATESEKRQFQSIRNEFAHTHRLLTPMRNIPEVDRQYVMQLLAAVIATIALTEGIESRIASGSANQSEPGLAERLDRAAGVRGGVSEIDYGDDGGKKAGGP